jgi:hypothetical protein
MDLTGTHVLGVAIGQSTPPITVTVLRRPSGAISAMVKFAALPTAASERRSAVTFRWVSMIRSADFAVLRHR